MKQRLLFILIPLLMVACHNKEMRPTPQTRKTLVVDTSTVILSQSYSAAIQGQQDVSIFPQISGFMTKMRVSEGERVVTGQLLFEIDPVNFEAALRVAEANVKAAEALVATQQLTFDSKKTLFAQKVISKYDLQVAENALLTAQAQLAQAQAGVTNAKQNLSYTQVKSPCSGVVGKLPFRVGALVSPQMPKPLTTISDNSQVYVYFSMSESQMISLVRQFGSIEKAIDEMPDVSLQLCNGTIYEHKGRVESISGVLDQQTGAVSVKAVFSNPDRILLSGGACNVTIPDVRTQVIVIPQDATYEIQNKIFAYRVEDGKTKAVLLSVDPMPDGKSYIVNSGLNIGDRIISEGAGLVKEGEEVL